MVLIIFIIISILFVIFEPTIKGYLGEKAVAGNLSKLPEQQYKLLNDVMLQTNHGITQIDHVVVSVCGIFVIETKNYKGWITGSEYGENWTKNMYGKKYFFRNPLKQNYAHVKALEETLGLPEDVFIPIVAFSRNSDIKVKTNQPVVYIGQLKQTIQKYDVVKFREEELSLIVSKICDAKINSGLAKKQHMEQIRNQIKSNKASIEKEICPKCGGQLVQRKGKYGVFTGCSNYPKCKYTIK